MLDTPFDDIARVTLDDGRIQYTCQTPVERRDDGWGSFVTRTTIAVPEGTTFEQAATQSQAFQLTDEQLSHRQVSMHIDFSDRRTRRRTFAHNVYRFDDGSEAVGVILHPKVDRC